MGFLDKVLRTGSALYPVAGAIAGGINKRDERERKLQEQARAEQRQAQQDLQTEILNKSLIEQRGRVDSDVGLYLKNPKQYEEFKKMQQKPDTSISLFEEFKSNPELAKQYQDMINQSRLEHLPPSTAFFQDETGQYRFADRRNPGAGASPLPGAGGEGTVYSKPSASAEGKISDASALGLDVADAISMLQKHPEAVGTRFALARAAGTVSRPFGITPEKIAGKMDPDEGNMATRQLITNVAAFIRNLRAGTALTGTEKVELEPFIPDIGEDYAQVLVKLQGLQKWAQRREASYRRPTSDMPPNAPTAAPVTPAPTAKPSATDAARKLMQGAGATDAARKIMNR